MKSEWVRVSVRVGVKEVEQGCSQRKLTNTPPLHTHTHTHTTFTLHIVYAL